MAKIQALYGEWDPTGDWVTHIAIQTESNPHYVVRTYSRFDKLPSGLPDGMKLVPKEAADKLFEFKRGEISRLYPSPRFDYQR
jgi:hypothetical protein